jgi:hypothetical protein
MGHVLRCWVALELVGLSSVRLPPSPRCRPPAPRISVRVTTWPSPATGRGSEQPHEVQHVLHPLDVPAAQFRNAPHFFPATASARGFSAGAGLCPCRPMRRCPVAPSPSPAALPTSATARAEAGYTPARRPRPRFVRQISSAAWDADPRSGLPRTRAADSGARPAGPPVERSPPRPPYPASSSPCRVAR